ncbi:protein TIFY 6B-like isoform X2 [Senna tora]|uniref:Protein TIFY n=1 Tax=Senna tora TaxID=362788 RepID=A0A834THB9_9FABA|nr:protein TIFY 6B-like isoform X2 [Senna tora]
MQWSFSSNKVSAVPQLLSFKASQEDKTTRKSINNLDPISSSSGYNMTTSTTTAAAAAAVADAYDSNHFKPIFKRSVSMGAQARSKDGMGAMYSLLHPSSGPQDQDQARIFSVSNNNNNNQSNLQRSSSRIVLQSNVVLCGNSANIKPHFSLAHAHGGGGGLSQPSKASNNIVGTTDLRNSPKSSAKPTQLTIFYAGSVCVYEDISPEKAQAIMLLAGNGTSSSPIQSKAVSSPNITTTTRPSSKDDAFIISQSYPSPLPLSPLPMTFHAASNCSRGGGGGSSCNINNNNNNNELALIRPLVVSSSSSAPNNNSHNLESPNVVASAKSAPPKMAPPPVGLPQARKASLARFLEKRKERVTGTSPYYMNKKSMPEGSTSRSDDIDFSINSTTSFNPAWLQAERTVTKTVSSGLIPDLIISSKRFSAISPCPWIPYPPIIAVHEMTLFSAMESKIARAFTKLPHLAYILIRAFVRNELEPKLQYSICRSTSEPMLWAPRLAQEDRTPRSVTGSGRILVNFISRKSSKTCLASPFCAYPEIIAFQLGTHEREQEEGTRLEGDGKGEGIGKATRAEHVTVESESLGELALLGQFP